MANAVFFYSIIAMPEEDAVVDENHDDLPVDFPFGHSPMKSPTYASVFAGGFDDMTYSLFKVQVEDDFDTIQEAVEYVNDVLATPTDEHGNTLLHAAAIRGDEKASGTIFLAIERADADLAKDFLEKRNGAGRTALQATPNPNPKLKPPTQTQTQPVL